MFSAFANIAKIPDLRKKTLITLGLLVLCRVGVFIPLPGVNSGRAYMGTMKEQKGSGFSGVSGRFWTCSPARRAC